MTAQILYTNANDCWENTAAFYSTLTNITIGNNSASDFPINAWIPFAVNLSKGQVITSATLKVVAVSADTSTVYFHVGCEDADSPAAPTTKEDLEGRTLTAAYLNYGSNAEWVVGTEYTFVVTAAIQEVLDHAGWTPQNTLAILIKDAGSGHGDTRAFASVENTTYIEAILEIVYSPVGGSAAIAISPTLIF